MKALLPLFVASLFFLSVIPELAQAAEPANSLAPKQTYEAGGKDEQGRLIIYVYKGTTGKQTSVSLKSDFGIMMYRDYEKHGEAHFLLARDKEKTVSDFTSYESFLKALGQLPQKSALTIYDRCTVPRFYDFYPVHQELVEKFENDCKRLKLKIAKDPKITCTCTLDER